MRWVRCLSSYQSITAFSATLGIALSRIQRRRFTRAGLDAFLDFERRLQSEKEEKNHNKLVRNSQYNDFPPLFT